MLQTLYLIPGFMSPAWMMYPMQRYLDDACDNIIRWDYPRVFVDLENTVSSLTESLDRHPDQSVSIVAHSFGDWIVRSALNRVCNRSVTRLISVCPVVTSVPVVQLAHQATGDLIPEFAVMASDERASIKIPEHLDVDRSCVWANGEVLVKRHADSGRNRMVWASHNSILFQPNAWRVIWEELLLPKPQE